VPYTRGFEPGLDREHYEKHVLRQREFGPMGFKAYCDLADQFLGSELDPETTYECTRPGGEVIRYNHVTGEFGVLHVNRVIGSYFRPMAERHEFPTNFDYFVWRCRH
jgi:hypothetical protein